MSNLSDNLGPATLRDLIIKADSEGEETLHTAAYHEFDYLELVQGLDEQGDPVRPTGTLATESTIRAFNAATRSDLPPVDWNNVNGTPHYRPLDSSNTICAAFGQKLGETAPKGRECKRCKQGEGPFSSCRIAFLPEDDMGPAEELFRGSCMCCAFSNRACWCTLRLSPEPEWVHDYFTRAIPSHTFRRGSFPAKRLKSRETASSSPASMKSHATRSSTRTSTRVSDPSPSVLLTPQAPHRYSLPRTAAGLAIPPTGTLYSSPLGDVAFNNLDALDAALGQVEICLTRAAFDRDMLISRRPGLTQQAGNIGGFAALIGDENETIQPDA